MKNFFVKSAVDLSEGGTIKITPHEGHTRDEAPSNVVGFVERVSCSQQKSTMTKQPRFLVGWALGHKDADIITLMEDENVRHNGSWTYSPEGRNAVNVNELEECARKDEKHETRGARLLGM